MLTCFFASKAVDHYSSRAKGSWVDSCPSSVALAEYWRNDLCSTMYNLFKSFKWLAFQTFSDGCLGSHNDEGRSELRYAVWIAEFGESLDCWTQKALLRFLLNSTSVSVFLYFIVIVGLLDSIEGLCDPIWLAIVVVCHIEWRALLSIIRLACSIEEHNMPCNKRRVAQAGVSKLLL